MAGVLLGETQLEIGKWVWYAGCIYDYLAILVFIYDMIYFF